MEDYRQKLGSDFWRDEGMARVFVLGMAVMDVVFNVPEFPKLAEKYRADDAVFVGGG